MKKPDAGALIASAGYDLYRGTTEIVQFNLGAKCNQSCAHCHVDSGPGRTERMSPAVIDRAFEVLENTSGVRTIDLTGGAPELSPFFRDVVLRARSLGLEIIDRCNLTVLRESGQEDTASFLAEQGVHIIASLPCYTEMNVDAQRGSQAFSRSITALRDLNALGYGRNGSGLKLDLVYNPLGAVLPGSQEELGTAYHRHLESEFSLSFNDLIAMANVPIARFARDLQMKGTYDSYLGLLESEFNPDTLGSLMCRNLVSIGWDGGIFDCDFNQALKMKQPSALTVFDLVSFDDLAGLPVSFGPHCLACMAGEGSSCFGSVIASELKYVGEAV